MSTVARQPGRALAEQPDSMTGPLSRRSLREALTSSTTLSVVDQAVISATRMATSVLIGRICGQDHLGTYYLAASIVLFVQGIQAQIIDAPFAVHSPRRKGNALRTFTGSIFVHQLIIMAASVAAILLFAGTVSFSGIESRLQSALFVLALVAVPLLLREFARGVSLAHLEIRGLLAIDATVALIQVGGLASLTLAGRLTVNSALLVLGGGCAVAFFGWFVAKWPTMKIQQASIANDWRHNWRFSKWALTSHLLGSTSPILMTWILTVSHGANATGNFAACMTIVGLAYVVVGGLANLAVPRAARAFAEGGGSQVRKTMSNTAILLGIPAALFIVFAFFAADQLAVLIYGDEFTNCGSAITLLGCWMLVNGFGIAAGSSLWAIGQPRANLAADVVAFVITVSLASTLCIPFGVLGIAWAMFLGILSGTVIRWATAYRKISELGHYSKLTNPICS